MRLLFAIMLLPLVLAADDKPQAAAGDAPNKRQLTAAELRDFYTDPFDSIVTEWADVDTDHKTWASFVSAGYIPVLCEAKLENGQLVARKGFKHLDDFYPGAERPRCCCYTCITEEFFDRRNKELLKDNYTLMKMQRLTDEKGKIRICALWVGFTPAPKP